MVGIGASAGGLAALKSFLQRTPADSGAAYVVVMHLSPEHESHLPTILQGFTDMPVEQVTGDVSLERNHVYVIPPNRKLSTIDTHLRLTPLEADRTRRATIDHFFRTLASTHADQAIAVVLSGTGSDGSLGIKDVKEAGGLVVVQDPADAEHDSMPQNALNTHLVDIVLPVARIPQRLVRFLRTTPHLNLGGLIDPSVEPPDARSLGKIFSRVRTHTSHDFTRYRRSTVLRRIARRMQMHGITTLPNYLARLHRDEREIEALQKDILIMVTNFFRDPEAFEALRNDVVPELFRGKGPNDHVRAWAVGCATGEEAYSVAMLLKEHAEGLASPPAIQVFATDVHDEGLRVGREGRYPEVIREDVTGERLERFFVAEEGGGYRVRKEIRDLVLFAPHNILDDPPFSKLDLITCRNLLIYLRRDVQQEALQLFRYALRPEGFLLLGSAESAEVSEQLQVFDKKNRIFRRTDSSPTLPRFPQMPISAHGRRAAAPKPAGDRPAISFGALHQALAERYAPPSLLVNRELEIVHVSEHAGHYLQQPGGEPTNLVLKRVPAELRLELRAALHNAFRKGQTTSSPPVPLTIDGHENRVTVRTMPTDDANPEFALVIFDSSGGRDAAVTRDERTTAPDATSRELREELASTKSKLQAIIEEYETSQEQMRATNQELQSMNEELRFTAEELETSKEELQSMNEELLTMNQENKYKLDELGQMTSDLQNLLAATEIATLFLDRQMRIKRFTPRVTELFNILGSDMGRPLGHLTHKLGYDGLLADAESVLRNLTPIEREVGTHDGGWYLMRLLPYRTLENRVDGVVLTFVDIAALKKAEHNLRSGEVELKALNETLEERVEDRTREVRALASALGLAEQRERSRIAQILHDDIQQILFALQIKLKSLRKRVPDDSVGFAAYLDGTNELVQGAIRSTRTLSVGLNPPVLRDEGLTAALRWLATQMQDSFGLSVALELPLGEETHVDDDQRVLLFQCARELLFNVVKHADVKHARLRAWSGDGTVRVAIEDDGAGFDSEAGVPDERDHTGLLSIREKLHFSGGEFTIESRAGVGTRAVVTLPLNGAARGHLVPMEREGAAARDDPE